MRISTVIASALFGPVLLAGCGKDPVAPASQQQSTAGTGVGAPPTDLNALQAGSAALLALISIPPNPATPPPGNCPYDSSVQMFVCPRNAFSTFASSTSYQLLDAANQPQSAYDATTTAAIRTVRDGSTTSTIASHSGTVTITSTNHDDDIVSGLLTDVRMINGSGSHLLTGSGGPVTTTFGTNRTTNNVALPKGSRWPQSGTITTETGVTSYSIKTTVTFNGTSTIAVRIERPTGTLNCTVDAEHPTTGARCN